MNSKARKTISKEALAAAWPIMAGYVVLGLPCGLLEHQAGFDPFQCFLISFIFYSGAGQYMIPNMFLVASSIPSIVASVSLVNTRQMLYSASLARFCEHTPKPLAFIFAATVTDESFGVNLARFQTGAWSVEHATIVNVLSRGTWALANTAGAVVGSMISVPTALASFAMTAIFICLLCMQKINAVNVTTVLAAMVGVYLSKLFGLSGAAILLGALFGMAIGFILSCILKKKGKLKTEENGPAVTDEPVEVQS